MRAIRDIFLVLAVAAVARGQHLAWIRQELPMLGDRPVLIGDLNQDGEPDLALPVWVLDNGPNRGHIELYFASGVDGTTLPQRITPGTGENIGWFHPVGDADGDRVPDLLMGGMWMGVSGFHALSGRTLQPLFHIPVPANLPPYSQWGANAAGAVDLNGDHLPDTVVSEPYWGIVYAYDHMGREIYRRSSPDPAFRWGQVAAYDDYDGDGCDDFLVVLNTYAGGAEIVSGRTGLPLMRILGVAPFDYLSEGITACGDLDGDGRRDVLLGGGAFSPGSMQAFSTATGQRLWAWYSGSFGDYFGPHMLGDVDVDQDGIVDPMATCPSGYIAPYTRGFLSVRSGRDGSEILRFMDWAPTNNVSSTAFGYLTAVPPRAGSTLPRFLVTAAAWSRDPWTGQNTSRWYMFEACPAGTTTVGAGCAGTLPRQPRIGLRQMAPGHSRATLSDAEPGALSILVLGASLQPTPLSPFGFPNCTLHPSVTEFAAAFPGVAGIASGYTFHDFRRDFAPTASTLGLTVHGQYVVLGHANHWPGGTTAALRWHFR